MRSKLGTKARLAAHITALVLLIMMLVYLDSPAPVATPMPLPSAAPVVAPVPVPAPAAPAPEAAIVQKPVMPVVVPTPTPEPLPPEAAPEVPPPAPIEAEVQAEEPAPEPEPEPVPEIETVATIETEDAPADHLSEPAPESGPAPEPDAAADETPSSVDVPAEAAPEPVVAEEPLPETPEPVITAEPEAEPVPAPQPDESGALVVADSAADGTVAVVSPLTNANLEVLGDNVYWLDPRHDLEQELAAIPEVGSLILLTPLPGYRVQGFEHVKTVAIPADASDLSRDAAEYFVYVAAESRQPVVAAALPGARGAAYFKGAYLLLVRKLPLAETLAEIAPELDEAGDAREEIEHRLAAIAIEN